MWSCSHSARGRGNRNFHSATFTAHPLSLGHECWRAPWLGRTHRGEVAGRPPGAQAGRWEMQGTSWGRGPGRGSAGHQRGAPCIPGKGSDFLAGLRDTTENKGSYQCFVRPTLPCGEQQTEPGETRSSQDTTRLAAHKALPSRLSTEDTSPRPPLLCLLSPQTISRVLEIRHMRRLSTQIQTCITHLPTSTWVNTASTCGGKSELRLLQPPPTNNVVVPPFLGGRPSPRTQSSQPSPSGPGPPPPASTVHAAGPLSPRQAPWSSLLLHPHPTVWSPAHPHVTSFWPFSCTQPLWGPRFLLMCSLTAPEGRPLPCQHPAQGQRSLLAGLVAEGGEQPWEGQVWHHLSSSKEGGFQRSTPRQSQQESKRRGSQSQKGTGHPATPPHEAGAERTRRPPTLTRGHVTRRRLNAPVNRAQAAECCAPLTTSRRAFISPHPPHVQDCPPCTWRAQIVSGAHVLRWGQFPCRCGLSLRVHARRFPCRGSSLTPAELPSPPGCPPPLGIQAGPTWYSPGTAGWRGWWRSCRSPAGRSTPLHSNRLIPSTCPLPSPVVQHLPLTLPQPQGPISPPLGPSCGHLPRGLTSTQSGQGRARALTLHPASALSIILPSPPPVTAKAQRPCPPWPQRRGRNYQPAEVLEADVELMPAAHLPAMGAVDVICGGQTGQGLCWGPALCSHHGELPGRGTP
ncbi:hypothetical protein Cadr_000013706 [Camelus dromedarius]|uniref:Uncharacterized protein n=1 Tax=Camelus dromedarius TaxID=9838 RepID=A0A5N4DC06_CAMDR|nr:hypothetical protein Cadr_000013706 [Camelus dromedarius]